MNHFIRRPLVAAITILAGCAAFQPAREEPAVLVASSPQNQTELSRVVGQALHQPAVMLAEDAFLHEDILIVERRLRRDENGMPMNGRETSKPERFRLIKQGADCFLIREGVERRWRLTQACAPIASRP